MCAAEAQAQLLASEWLDAQPDKPCLLVDYAANEQGAAYPVSMHATTYNEEGGKLVTIHWSQPGSPSGRTEHVYASDGTLLGRRLTGESEVSSAIELDGDGRIATERTTAQDGSVSTSQYRYDSVGRRIWETHDLDSDGVVDRLVTSTMEGERRVSGSITYTTYPGVDEPVTGDLEYHYDEQGRPIAEAELIDGELSEIWRFAYDERGRLINARHDILQGSTEHWYYYDPECSTVELQLGLLRE